MEIVIDPFDKASIAAAVQKLEEYAKSLEKNSYSLIANTLSEGASVANQIYAQNPGDHGVGSAHGEQSGNEGTLIATAPDGEIGFIEFGTGIRHREWQGAPGIEYTPEKHGTYGKKQGADPGWWYYGGELGNKDRGWEFNRGNITDGREPAEGMLWARQAMIDKVLDDAQEVFRS